MDGAEIYGGLARLALLHHICLRHQQGFVLLEGFYHGQLVAFTRKTSIKVQNT